MSRPRKKENPRSSVEDALLLVTPSSRIPRILSDKKNAVLDPSPFLFFPKSPRGIFLFSKRSTGLNPTRHGRRPSAATAAAAAVAAALASSSLLLASRLLNAPRHWTSPSSSLAQNL
jgi:hypothetical protein